MNKKTVFITLLALLVASVSTGAESTVQLQGLNYLKDVVVEKQGGVLVIRLDLQDSNVNFKPPVFFKKSVQVDLTNSYIRPAKRFFPTDDFRIPQVYVSQFDANTVRVRFIVGEDTQIINKNFHIEKQDGSLAIRVDKNVVASTRGQKKESKESFPVNQVSQENENRDILDELLKKVDERKQDRSAESMSTEERARSAAKSLAAVKAALGEEAFALPIQEEPVAEHLPSPLADKPVEPVKSANSTNAPEPAKTLKFLDSRDAEDSAPPDLMSTGMKMFSMLAVVLGLMFLILYVLKNHVMKNGMFGANEKLVKVLGTGMLAPRKSIALVEVAGEVLVLGISNEHIALLSTIREEDKIAQIKSISASRRGGLLPLARTAGDGNSRGKVGVDGAIGAFSKYIKQFSAEKPEPRHSATGVAALIQKNLGKIRTA